MAQRKNPASQRKAVKIALGLFNQSIKPTRFDILLKLLSPESRLKFC